MQLALLAVPLWTMAASDVQLLRWTMWIPGMLSTAAGAVRVPRVRPPELAGPSSAAARGSERDAVLIEIDPTSPLPPYEQLRINLTALVLNGALDAGAKLPSIRQLAGDLGLAPGTVARAYRELEADGVVHGPTARAARS